MKSRTFFTRPVALLAVSSLLVIAPAKTLASDCNAASATLLPESSTAVPIEFMGEDIGEDAMRSLWSLASWQWNTHDFGKAIAAGQNWFGACKYPGIGLAAGSGYNWRNRNVTLYVWANGVDFVVARQTILSLVQPAAVTTTTTSTTTTTATTTTTTLPPSEQATSAVVLETSTSTSTTLVTSSSRPDALAVEEAPLVSAQTIAVEKDTQSSSFLSNEVVSFKQKPTMTKKKTTKVAVKKVKPKPKPKPKLKKIK